MYRKSYKDILYNTGYIANILFIKSIPFKNCESLYCTAVTYNTREGDGTPLQYSCLENPMDGGAWWVAVHGVMKSWTRLSVFTFTFHFHALEKEMATHSPVFLPGESQGWGSLWAAVYGVIQSDTTEVT